MLWPERFGEAEVANLERALGPYRASGRLDQCPTPPGGGIIKREWWQEWPSDRPPACEFILASIDTAYTTKAENDANAITIWGIFRDQYKNPKLIALYAWQGRCELNQWVEITAALCSGPQVVMTKEKQEEILALMNECGWPAKMLPRIPVDRLLIELKATGHSLAQELQRLYPGRVAIEGIKLGAKDGDKVSRLYSVQPLFYDGAIYAPNRKWAQKMIDEVSMFPKGAHDDITDSLSQSLQWLRRTGLMQRREEAAEQHVEELRYKPKQRSLY